MENQESKGNGFDLELILSKAPSDEIRNEMIVDAVQRRITNNPEYFKKAVETLEGKNNYQAIAFLYGADERSPFYDSGKSVEYFTKAAQLYGFKKDIKSKIGTGAVLKEMGRKSFRGTKFALGTSLGALYTITRALYTIPTSIRKITFDEKDTFIGVGRFRFTIGVISGLLGTIPNVIISAGMKGFNGEISPFPFYVWGATNIASGAYEWFRYERNKMEEKIKKGLEEELENTPLSNMPIDLAPDTGIRTHYKEQMEEEYERKINSEKRKVSE